MPAAEDLIRSRANPLFKRLRALKRRSIRGELCLLEGARLVEEALAADVTVREIVVAPGAEHRPAVQGLLTDATARGVPVRRVAASLLASLSEAESTTGVIALAAPPVSDPERLFSGTPLLVVVDGVQDPGNLGGLLRTAEAAGASGACLAPGCADPFSWKALRGSMGSALRLPLVRDDTAEALIPLLEKRGVRLLATTPDGGTRYDEVDLRGPVAVAFGREGSGLRPQILERASGRLRIPLASPVDSLNVGVAAGLVLFEAARQRGFPSLRDPG